MRSLCIVLEQSLIGRRGIVMKRHLNCGVNRVELVIVITVLAVVSAIAVPRITRAARGADESALGRSLTIIRTSIETYAAEHHGTYPGAAADGAGGAAGSEEAFISQLTMYSDKAGNVANDRNPDTGKIYGPYMYCIPPLSVGANTGQTRVKVVAGTAAPTVGGAAAWVYNCTTGKIIANCGDSAGSGLTYDQW
jgi:type II secretory pathway pseudopilin PulG